MLFGLEYAHAMPILKRTLAAQEASQGGERREILFAECVNRETQPLNPQTPASSHGNLSKDLDEASTAGPSETKKADSAAGETIGVDNGRPGHKLGGLRWSLPDGRDMDNCQIIWIGEEGPALTNIMLTYNSCSVSMLPGLS